MFIAGVIVSWMKFVGTIYEISRAVNLVSVCGDRFVHRVTKLQN